MWFGISILLEIHTVVLQVMTLSCLIDCSSILEICCVSIFRIEVYSVFYQGKQNVKCHLDVMLISVVYVQSAPLLTKKDWKGFQAWRLKTSRVWCHVVDYGVPDTLKVRSVCLQSQAVHEDSNTLKITVLKILPNFGNCTQWHSFTSQKTWIYNNTVRRTSNITSFKHTDVSTVIEFHVLLGTYCTDVIFYWRRGWGSKPCLRNWPVV
jgi:hypothetical protein